MSELLDLAHPSIKVFALLLALGSVLLYLLFMQLSFSQILVRVRRIVFYLDLLNAVPPVVKERSGDEEIVLFLQVRDGDAGGEVLLVLDDDGEGLHAHAVEKVALGLAEALDVGLLVHLEVAAGVLGGLGAGLGPGEVPHSFLF